MTSSPKRQYACRTDARHVAFQLHAQRRQTAWHMASYVVTRSPKDWLQTICCFGGGTSSSEIQLSSLSSRKVLSSTTLKFFLINTGFARASYSAVVMPIVLSVFEILRPASQISSTGCSESSFSVRFGLPEVSTSTPPNCRHSLDAHCALLASVLVGPIPIPIVSSVPEHTYSRSCRRSPQH